MIDIDELLIKDAEVLASFVSVSPNLETETVQRYVFNAQRLDLRKMLSKDLYELISDPTVTEDEHEGIDALRAYAMPVIAYFAYSRLVLEHPIYINDVGLQSRDKQSATPETLELMKQESQLAVTRAKEHGEILLEEVALFMVEYPEFDAETNNKQGSKVFLIGK